MDSRPSWAGGVDEPAVTVLRSNTFSRMARRTNQIAEDVTKIKNRVDKTIQTFERTQGIPINIQNTDMEILEDLDELQNILRDHTQKRRYQQTVTVFIVGYQEACGQRRHLLTQLQEFFSLYSKMSEEKEDYDSEDYGVDLDGIVDQMTGALRSAETAMSRLVDIHTEIMSNVNNTLSAATSGKRQTFLCRIRKKLEKAVNQAKEDIVMLTDQLLQAQEDLTLKDQQTKDLSKQNENKIFELNYFKGLLETTKKSLQTLQNETAIQRSLLDAEIRMQAQRLEELENQVSGKQSSDISTQWEDLDSTFRCDKTEFSVPNEEENIVQETEKCPPWNVKPYSSETISEHGDVLDDGRVPVDPSRSDVHIVSYTEESEHILTSIPVYEENTRLTPDQSEDTSILTSLILEKGSNIVITLHPLSGKNKLAITSIRVSEDSQLLITSQPSAEEILHTTRSHSMSRASYSSVTSFPGEGPDNIEDIEICPITPFTDPEGTPQNFITPTATEQELVNIAPISVLEDGRDTLLLHSECEKTDQAATSYPDEAHNHPPLPEPNEMSIITSHPVTDMSTPIPASLPASDKMAVLPLSLPVSQVKIPHPPDQSVNSDISLIPDKNNFNTTYPMNEGYSGLMTSVPDLFKINGDLAFISVTDEDKIIPLYTLRSDNDMNDYPVTSPPGPDTTNRLITSFNMENENARSIVPDSMSDNSAHPDAIPPAPLNDTQSVKSHCGVENDARPTASPVVANIYIPDEGMDSSGHEGTLEEDKMVQTEIILHAEREDLSSEDIQNELCQVSQRIRMCIQEIKQLLNSAGYDFLIDGLNAGVQNLNEDGISGNLTQLENVPAVLFSLLQRNTEAMIDESVQNGFKKTIHKVAAMDSDLHAHSAPVTQSCRPVDKQIKSPIINEYNDFHTLKFSRLDEKYNKWILKRAAEQGDIPFHAFKDACRGMSQYRQLVQERIRSLVRGYLLYISWDRAETLLKQQTSHKLRASHTLSKVHDKKQQTLLRWKQQRTQSQDERLHVLSSLNQMFHGLQEESGIFLIKPVLSWTRSSTVLEGQRQPHLQDKAFQKRCCSFNSASVDQIKDILTCSGKYRSVVPKQWNYMHTHKELRPLVVTPKLLEMDVHRYLCNECCVMSKIHNYPSRFPHVSSTPLRNMLGVRRTSVFPAL
ncbi:uncharacterized protein LOC134601858 [Pelobates fuscus]|uniref:uncharacterized protein LOC134601858 n=1 Tax=Pelobates fuscus TaxID=191477 RepID=UPI002FE4E0E3